MLLNVVLFFLNVMLISFCATYINHLYTDVNKVNTLKKKVKEQKTEHKYSYEEQLAYISNVQDIDREGFPTFGFKVLFLMVAIGMALLINKIEPLMLFGVRLNIIYIIIIIVILSYFQNFILKKLGVKL